MARSKYLVFKFEACAIRSGRSNASRAVRERCFHRAGESERLVGTVRWDALEVAGRAVDHVSESSERPRPPAASVALKVVLQKRF